MSVTALPHVQPDRIPAQAAPISNLFGAHAEGNPYKIKDAEAEYAATTAVNRQVAQAQNERRQGEYQRYQKFEKVLEDSYRSRGFADDLDGMTMKTRRGLVNAASAVYAIHETAEEARADIRKIGEDALAKGQASLDKTAADADAQFEALRTEVQQNIRRIGANAGF